MEKYCTITMRYLFIHEKRMPSGTFITNYEKGAHKEQNFEDILYRVFKKTLRKT